MAEKKKAARAKKAVRRLLFGSRYDPDAQLKRDYGAWTRVFNPQRRNPK